jgi:hypothetical protein
MELLLVDIEYRVVIAICAWHGYITQCQHSFVTMFMVYVKCTPKFHGAVQE